MCLLRFSIFSCFCVIIGPYHFILVTARRYTNAVYGICCRRVSVRPSVTRRYCTKRAKHRITHTTPYDSPWTLVFWCQRSRREYDRVTPNGGAKRWGRLQSAIFDQYLAIAQKRCKIGTQLLWNANRNAYSSIEWRSFQWPWVTLTALKEKHSNFDILYRLS